MKKAHVLIVGSGVAALQLAKRLRDDMNVIIITKSYVNNGNSNLAQGGIAAALGRNDRPEYHFIDTLEAGRFHNDQEAVRAITDEGPSLIRELLEEGCPFDKSDEGNLLLGMEGAHSNHRIIHGGGDATGKCVMDHLEPKVTDRLEIMENRHVFELIIDRETCLGVKCRNKDGTIEYFYADHVVLATGGCGQLYSHTSNAKTVTGDGIALAYRAGAEIADMEFIQFHPTLLYINGETRGLVSEAVRGDGGRLVTEDGRPIMEGIHPMGDLGPRHVVAQTIYNHLREGKRIFLDVSGIHSFEKRFPTITSLCEKYNIDWKKRIPVAPGSHFLMGGIKTDLWGRTSIKGLYAIGEVACTGLHGANRLASNSLLEGLYMGKKLAEWLNAKRDGGLESPIQPAFRRTKNIQRSLPTIEDIQQSMMDNVGIIRTEEGLVKQKCWLESFDIDGLIKTDFENFTTEEMTRAFMLITSWLITNAALNRTESRGGHFRSDFPCENDQLWLRKQTIQKRNEMNEPIEAAAAT